MLRRLADMYSNYKEVINYLIFGFLTFVVSMVTYYLFISTILNANDGFQLQVANILSWCISVCFAYITNRKFVFISKSNGIFKEIISFFSARIVTLLLDMFIMFLGVTLLGFNNLVIKFISQVVVIVSNYFFSKLFVFK